MAKVAVMLSLLFLWCTPRLLIGLSVSPVCDRENDLKVIDHKESRNRHDLLSLQGKESKIVNGI